MARLNDKNLHFRIEALRAALMQEIERAATPLDPAQAELRRQVCRSDFGQFLGTYLPHYFPSSQFSAMHKSFFALAAQMGQAGRKGRGLRKAKAAPRGNGKTSLIKALVLFCVVYELKHFIVLISDTIEQAAESMEAVKVELEDNPRLKADFPAACGLGPVWNQAAVVTAGGIKIKAYGTGKRIRGATHGNWRPDLVLCDDLENDENVRTLEQRQKAENWFWKSVVPLGPPDESHDVVVAGTVLHYDSLLSRLLNNPAFEAERWKAILAWPSRMDLWDEFANLYARLGRPAALDFYQERRAAMNEGALVLWPEVQPLAMLMAKRAEQTTSFGSEYQNEPLDEADRVFDSAGFRYWEALPAGLVYVGAIDPSMGGSSKGDPSAIVVLGVSQAQKALYVVEALIRRIKPDQQIAEMIRLQKKYNCVVWAVEVVQFQEFFKDELVKQARAQGVLFPAQGVRPTGDKHLRIEGLQPHTKAGVILFCKGHSELLEQLDHFPKADHDDGPDALQMAFVRGAALLRSGLGAAKAAPRAQQHSDLGSWRGYT